MHVILTFLSKDKSEEKQIFGRTCRQDDPGSARKILFANDLVEDPRENLFTLYKGQQKDEENNWDEFLEGRRDKHQVHIHTDWWYFQRFRMVRVALVHGACSFSHPHTQTPE